ncbi:Flavinator of succinate dehydrogenase-domain-containing protein [Cantharellus anzutake]|uniref:Flavinator of succinate dehydrogenase-domain-containing protein n=1 Tax=Cantharellus anzutake TaxID=1750568 RepID=UPI001906F1B7|nr:Flavinator of succinate dehydrogenase-domain-containing protein [Cantharellus anzutake]KAF8324847.1 Flavinator of succinate dehydrogenase-domain-containing protein [Cantharellus anzutake]
MSTQRLARLVRMPVLGGHRSLSFSCQNFEKDFRDPFPLPLSSDKFIQTDQIDESLLPHPIPRPNESLDSLRARLNYQSRKRGTLENDLLLSTFAKEHITTMTRAELEEFDKLMDEPDWDIYYWSIDKKPPPSRWAGTRILEKLRVHARNEGRVVRRMPELPHLDRRPLENV